MPQFITELTVERSLAGAEERDVLADVGRLAERCADDPSTELHLEGD
jgi:hypothetical protein